MSPIEFFGQNTTNDPTVHADDPMNEAQAARLREVCKKLGEPFDGNLTHKQAHDRIEALEARLD